MLVSNFCWKANMPTTVPLLSKSFVTSEITSLYNELKYITKKKKKKKKALILR